MLQEYMKFIGPRCIEVRCKGECNTVLLKMNKKKVLEPTEHYAELVIAMKETNGQLSKHETGVCKQCKARILADGPAISELENIWAQDVFQMIENAIRNGTPKADAYARAETVANRSPICALKERGRGES